MATKDGETQKPQQRTIPDTSYPMYLPRMGHCIIINNVASFMPASQTDVAALQTAYKQVGFEVYSYKDCTAEEMQRINTWVLARESHQYSNCLMYNIICFGSDTGKLLDVNKQKVFSVHQLVDDLSKVETLLNKPKLIVIQTCEEESDRNEFKPVLPKKKDCFIAYGSLQKYRQSSDHDGGSLYLQCLAEQLQNEYMKNSVDKIFLKVEESLEYKTELTDKILMEMAEKISSDKMEAVAVGYLDMDGAVVKRLSHSRREDKLMFNYDVLEMWRNKSIKNTREKLAKLLLEAADKGSYVDSRDVTTILQVKTKSLTQHLVEVDNLTRILHFADFHRKTVIITKTDGDDTGTIRTLEEEIKQLKDELTKYSADNSSSRTPQNGKTSKQYEQEIRMLKEEIKKLKKLSNKIGAMTVQKERLEREKEEDEKRKTDLEQQLRRYQDNYEKKMQKMRQEIELKQQTVIDQEKAAHKEEIQKLKEEKEREKETELQKTKKLEEAVWLSQKLIEDLAAEKARYLSEAKEKEREAKKRQIERLREAELERIKRLEKEAKQSAERLQSLSAEEIEEQNTDEDGVSADKSITDDREDEHTKLLKEQIRNLKTKADEAIQKDRSLSHYKQQVQQIQKEKEEAEKQKLAEGERLKKVERELAKLTTEKVKHEEEMEKLKVEKEILKQTDLQKIRKLEEERKLSAEEFAAEKERFERELQNMKEDKKRKYEIVQNERMRKIEDELKVKYETDLKEELQKREKEFKQIKEAQMERLGVLEGENKKLKENLTHTAEDVLVVPEPATSETGSSPTKVPTISPVVRPTVSVSDHSAQAEGRVKMTRISTLDIDTVFWSSSIVMAKTGEVVLHGLFDMDDPSSIIIYNREEGGGWAGKQIEPPCKHNIVCLLGVEVKGWELLALSCKECEKIKLLNLNTQQVVATAFSGAKVDRMCHGNTNRLYVESVGGSVLELDCSNYDFAKIKRINAGIDYGYYGMCYVPSPHRYIVLSYEDGIRAISCDDDKIIWTVLGEIDGKEIDARGLSFCPPHNAVLVCDHGNCRMLVLDPSNGSCLQTINMRDMGDINDIHFCKEQIIVLHRPQEQGLKCSYFSVK